MPEPHPVTPGRVHPAAERAVTGINEYVLAERMRNGHLFSEGERATRPDVSRTPLPGACLWPKAQQPLTILDARRPVEGAAVERLLGEPAPLPAPLVTLREDPEVQRRAADRRDLGSFDRFDERPVLQQLPDVLAQREELVGTIKARDKGRFTPALQAPVDGARRR